MDDNFDELGNFVGSAEYSDSEASDDNSWEDVEEAAEKDAVVKSVYGPNVEVAHYKHDAQDASRPLVAPQKQTVIPESSPPNWAFHKGLMDSAPSLVRSVAVVGHVNHGKSSFVELFTGPNSTDTGDLEQQRGLTLKLSCHTVLVQDTNCKSYVLNIVDTPGHVDFDDEVQAAKVLADNSVLVVDVVEGCVLARFGSPSVVILNGIDKLILDLRLPPSKAFDRLRFLVEEELAMDPHRIIFASTKFKFAFSLRSFAAIYAAYQEAEGTLDLWNATSFTSFVLEPLYKLFSYGLLGMESQAALASLSIYLTKAEWNLNYDNRIRLILERFFEDPAFGAVVDVLKAYTRAPHMLTSQSESVHVAKHVKVGDSVFGLVRVVSDFITAETFHSLWIPMGARVVKTDKVCLGNWALLPRVEPAAKIHNNSFVRIGLELLHDSLAGTEKLARGLEAINELHPALSGRLMETGECALWGTGELYLDCVVQEFRAITDLSLRVANPTAQLRETVSETSYVASPTKTASAQSSVTVVASPLSQEVVEELQNSVDTQRSLLQLGWSQNEADSVWAVYKGNVLTDGSSPPLLSSIDEATQEALVQGFEWACAEGPLMEEAMVGVHFKVTESELQGLSQLIPTMRRACHAAALVASPRIMEPWMRATVVGPLTAGKAVYSELAKRRGKVDEDRPILGTNLYITQGTLPLMDAFGFEIDVLCNVPRRNDAQVNIQFDHWQIVDGDPLDKMIAIPRLKPAAGQAMARDFMVKTRRRKGLIAEPALERYLDDDVARAILSA